MDDMRSDLFHKSLWKFTHASWTSPTGEGHLQDMDGLFRAGVSKLSHCCGVFLE